MQLSARVVNDREVAQWWSFGFDGSVLNVRKIQYIMRLMGISEETLDVKQHWRKYAQDTKNAALCFWATTPLIIATGEP